MISRGVNMRIGKFKFISMLTICLFVTLLCSCSKSNNNLSVKSNQEKVTKNTIPKDQEQTRIVTKNKINDRVMVLEYHCVSDNIFGLKGLFVSPQNFESQMQFLKDNGYTVITFDQLDNFEYISKPVIITFDDGYENNYKEAYPILKKYGYKATIFMCANFIDKSSMLKSSQIKEMSDLINFQSHTLSHPDLTSLNSNQIHNELAKSKEVLEELTNSKVNVFAYPMGSKNQTVVEITKKYYKYAVNNMGGVYFGNNDYEIERVYISRSTDMKTFEQKISYK